MIVAGVDFGTQSVRATLLDTKSGEVLGNEAQDYMVHRSGANPLIATQSYSEQMSSLQIALSRVLEKMGVQGTEIESLSCATTGSSVIFTDENLEPVSDYYLWCDHRAHREAEEITSRARAVDLEAIKWCGNTYSHEWGYAKVLHFLRNNGDMRKIATLAVENCDMVTAVLCGITDPNALVRSVCAMGHKWMWNEKWGGYPSDAFLGTVDPLLGNASMFTRGTVKSQGEVAGRLCPTWAEKLGLRTGIPIAVGAFDAHWDAVGAGAVAGDMVNIIGTSTCMIGVLDTEPKPVVGICGIVPGSVLPNQVGVEAGLSAVGDIFASIARRSNRSLAEMSQSLLDAPRRMTGLLRVPWDNGDRTILVDATVGGILLGLDLEHTAEDELQAAIEGTAFQTKLILDHIGQGLGGFKRIINGGGIPAKNRLLNQIYADVLNTEILVPENVTTGLGPGIFSAVCAGAFASIEEAQDAFCGKFDSFSPDPKFVQSYAQNYQMYFELYNSFGASIGQHSDILRSLKSERNSSS